MKVKSKIKKFGLVLGLMFFDLIALTFIPSTASAQKEWTFMVYLDGDNNLENAAIEDFKEMAQVGSNNDVNIVVQMDRSEGYDTSYGNWEICHRFKITQGMTPSPENAISDWGDGYGGREVNMGSPAALLDFIKWATTNYPAQKYALILWNHGGGWREKRRMLHIKGIKTNGVNKAICWDETSGDDCLYMSEVKQAIVQSGKKLHLVGFDACLMGMVEVAYQIATIPTQIDVMVASQEDEPEDGWPYDTILNDLVDTPTMSPHILGQVIVNRYGKAYPNEEGITQSAIDLAKIKDLSPAISQFASSLEYYWDIIRNARAMSDQVGAYADLKHFSILINSMIEDTIIDDNAKLVIAKLKDAIIANYSDSLHPNFYGLSIYFPKDKNDSEYDDYVNIKPIDFPNDTTWDEFLIRFCKVSPSIPKIAPLYSVDIGQTFTVSWSKTEDGILYYELQEANTITISAWITIGTTSGTSSIIPGKLTSGLYFYRVRAINTMGETSNWSMIEDIWVGTNTPPQIQLITPPADGTITDTSYIIRWADKDPDDNALISLYWDTDNKDYDGKLIISGINEDEENNCYTWTTTYMPQGIYYIYAKISDGKEAQRKSSPVYSNYSGPLTITHGTKSWTLMLYLDGDNNLEQYAINDVNTLEKVGSSDKVNVIVQLDGIDIHPETCRYYILQDDNELMINSPVIAELGEVNMGNKYTVINFATWTMTNYPAQNYALVFMNHGGGWRNKKELYLNQIKYPDKAVCWDDTSDDDSLYMSELKQALSFIKTSTTKVNLIGFDACLMGMVEVAYEIKDEADVMVASEEVEITPGWCYESILRDLIGTPTMTAPELAQWIVERYRQYYLTMYSFTTQSAIDLAKISQLAGTISSFAQILRDQWGAIQNDIKTARENTDYVLSFESKEEAPYIDLHHFASLIATNTTLPTATLASAESVKREIENVVIENYAGSAHPYFKGLSIYFPQTKGDEEYYEYVIDKVIDFPQATVWNEFLQLYANTFAKGGFTGTFTDHPTDIDEDKLYETLIIDAEVTREEAGSYSIMGELYDIGGNVLISSYYGGTYYDSPGTKNVSVAFKGTDISASKINGPYRFKIILKDIDTLVGTTSNYNYKDFINNGSLTIVSNPAGANIYLDGTNTGFVTTHTFTNISPGTHTIKLTLSGYENWYGTTTVITGSTTYAYAILIPNPITNVIIISATATVEMLGTQSFTAQGVNQYGYPIIGATYTWTLVPVSTGIGYLNTTTTQTAVFTATNPGTAVLQVTAEFGTQTVIGTTTITVVKGKVHHINVKPATNPIEAKGTTSVTAKAYNRYGFELIEITKFDWQIVQGSGTIKGNSSQTVVLETNDFVGTLTLTAATDSVTGTGTVIVIHGSVNSVSITPNPASVKVTGSQTFVANVVNQFGHLIPASELNYTWRLNSLIGGSITPTTVAATTTFTAGTKTGNVEITAEVEGKKATATVTVIPGTIKKLAFVQPTVDTCTIGMPGTMTIQMQDEFGNDVATYTTIIVSGDEQSRFAPSFSGAIWSITATFTIAGTNNVTFFFKQNGTTTIPRVTITAIGANTFTTHLVNILMLTGSSSGTLIGDDGKTKVEIDQGDIMDLGYIEIDTSGTSTEDVIEEANKKLRINRIEGTLRRFTLHNATITPMAKVRIFIPYQDSNPDDGYVDGTKIRETSLKMYRLVGTGTAAIWQQETDFGVDTTNNIVYADISNFSFFILMGPGFELNLDKAFVYPNPYYANRDASVGINFDKLTEGSIIQIFTIAGELVKEIRVESSPQNWDICNSAGEKVASGIYIYLIKDPAGNKKVGKLGIIR